MMQVAAVSYALGAVSFAVLLVLQLWRWRGRLGGWMFVLASVLSLLWCVVSAAHALTGTPSLRWVFLAETLRVGAWLTLLLALLERGRSDADRIPARARWATRAVWGGALAYTVWAMLAVPGALAVPGQAVAGLLLAASGALAVEQLYRNTLPDGRWPIKHLCLGLGAVFVLDIYFYAEGVLLSALSAEIWAARGAVSALTAPLIGIAAQRNPEGAGALAISRRLAFYSTSLAGVGVYLLAMAAGGYYVRSIGGSWGGVAQVVFLVAALLALVVALFSAQVRATVRVLLNKHFYTYKYDYREEWLRLSRLLFSPSEGTPVPARALKAVAEITDSPNAGLWLLRDDSYQPSGGDFAGRDSPAIGGDAPLVRFLLEQEWIIDLDEYGNADPRYAGLSLPEWLVAEKRAWLVLPLMHGTDLLGIMVLARPRAPHPLTWEDIDLLKTVGRQVAGVLAEHQAATRVAEASQFDAYNRLSAFIMHDLKNLIAQQSLVVGNAARHKDNPEFIEDAIQTVDNSVKRMARLLEQLQSGHGAASSSRVSVTELCERVVEDCRPRHAGLRLELVDDGMYVEAARDQLALVFGHVVRNGQDALGPDGHVTVRVRRDGDAAVIEVEDDGAGMEEHFVRERLFKPFDTTKGNKGMGIGAYQTREFVRAAGGDVHVESRVGAGTRFVIRLPLLALEAVAGEPSAAIGAGAMS
jgi:putative PEP-CTERM system histidine kinase